MELRRSLVIFHIMDHCYDLQVESHPDLGGLKEERDKELSGSKEWEKCQSSEPLLLLPLDSITPKPDNLTSGSSQTTYKNLHSL